VPDPWSARILPGARRSLRRLAVTPGVSVALISGRTVADLAARARVGGVSYRGDHGAERAEAVRGFRPSALRSRREPASAEAVRVAAHVKRHVPAAVPEPWLVLEDKATAATFHFRAAPDVDAARARVLRAVDAADPGKVLQRSGGRRSVELRPPGASTKGDALRELIAARLPEVVVMLGDDANDALAFDALRAEREGGRIAGLAVAVAGHADVTAAVAPRADVVLRDPRETARLLTRLAGRLGLVDAG
jgi:trehalose 6-phosphate phosphatase